MATVISQPQAGDRFRWRVSTASGNRVRVTNNVVEFEGFQQTSPQQLKNYDRDWNITVSNCDQVEASDIELFLEKHANHATSFEFKHPGTGRWHRVKVRDWRVTWNGPRTTQVTITAKEVRAWPL